MSSTFKTILSTLALTSTLTFAGSSASTPPVTTSIDSSANQLSFGPPHLPFFSRSDDGSSNFLGYVMGSINYTKQFSADLDGTTGDIDSDQFALLTPLLMLNYGDWHLMTFGQYSQTEFSAPAASLIPDSTLHSASLPLLLIKNHSDRMVSGIFARPSWSGDFDAHNNDTFSVAAGVGYVVSDNFKFIAGAQYSDTYGDTSILPAIYLSYRPCDNVETYILGPSAGVTYSVNDDWFLRTQLSYSAPAWKVEADGLAAERSIEVSKLDLSLLSEHRIRGNFWASFTLGYSFAREVKIEDNSSNTLWKNDIDPGAFARVGINYRY